MHLELFLVLLDLYHKVLCSVHLLLRYILVSASITWTHGCQEVEVSGILGKGISFSCPVSNVDWQHFNYHYYRPAYICIYPSVYSSVYSLPFLSGQGNLYSKMEKEWTCHAQRQGSYFVQQIRQKTTLTMFIHVSTVLVSLLS